MLNNNNKDTVENGVLKINTVNNSSDVVIISVDETEREYEQSLSEYQAEGKFSLCSR